MTFLRLKTGSAALGRDKFPYLPCAIVFSSSLFCGLASCSNAPNQSRFLSNNHKVIIFNPKPTDPPVRISYMPLPPQKNQQKNLLVLNIQVLAPLSSLQIELYGDRGVQLAEEEYVENHGFLPQHTQIRLNVPLQTRFIAYPKNTLSKNKPVDKQAIQQKYFVNLDLESQQRNGAQHRRYTIPVDVMP